MSKKIALLRRRDIFNYIEDGMFIRPDCGWDLLSISDTDKEKIEVGGYFMSEVKFKNPKISGYFTKFLDINGERSGFTVGVAKGIIRFLKETDRKNRSLIIQCSKGFSRGIAITNFAVEHFNSFEHPNVAAYGEPNQFVYSQLEKVYNSCNSR